MKLDVDAIDIDLTCSACGQEFKKPFGRLKAEHNAVFPKCGVTSLVDTEQAERTIKDIEEDLRRSGFR